MAKTFKEYQEERCEKEWKQKVEQRKAAMGNADRVARATEWKSIGNEKYRAGNFGEARDYYREAIFYVEDLVDARRKERVELMVPLCTNLAQVHLKLGEHAAAEEVAGKVLQIADIPRNNVAPSMKAKALFRRGVARQLLGKLEEAREDLAAALKLQPEAAEVSSALAEVRSSLAAKNREARAVMGGFLCKKSATDDADKEKAKQAEERRRQVEERQKARRARAEQRQQMQDAFAKLAKGSMLYEAREKEMEPVRAKELEKQRTLELERDLMAVIHESKGQSPTTDFDEFMSKKEAECVVRNAELDQKRKVLDKLKKEKQWAEDDAWRGQRDLHRQQLLAEREAAAVGEGPKAMWEAKEVARWCEQRLREVLVAASVQAEGFLSPELATAALSAATDGSTTKAEGTWQLTALVTDVLKLNGDAAVLRLNPQKPPLHFFDYFLKLDWEVAAARPSDSLYRTAEDLLQEAAASSDFKAPPSVVPHRVMAGTFKIREFSSEELPEDGQWPLETKVRHPCGAGEEVKALADQLCGRLRERIQDLLGHWLEEYRERWN